MRSFYLKLLQELDKLTGLKQWERLMSIEDVEVRKTEINGLLDILCRVSDQFPMIPVDDQQAIIKHAVISDKDFIGLNAKFIYRSLHTQHEKYVGREQNHETKPEAEPLTGEARQKMLDLWLKSLNGFGEKIECKSHVKVWEETLPPKDKGIVYQSTGPEVVFQREMHLQYIKANYDKDGKPLPTWLPENEWLKNQK
jgi:hypothetical protein